MARYCTKHSSVNIDEHNNKCPICENESKEPPPNFCMKHDNPVPLVDGSCIVCAEEPKEKEKPILELEMLFELVKNNSCTITGIVADIKNLVEFNTTLFRHIEKLEERLINAIKDGPKRYESIGPP